MRELFDKKGKRKEKRHEKKRETIFHMIRQKKGAKFARCVADEAGSKFQPLDAQ